MKRSRTWLLCTLAMTIAKVALVTSCFVTGNTIVGACLSLGVSVWAFLAYREFRSALLAAYCDGYEDAANAIATYRQRIDAKKTARPPLRLVHSVATKREELN